jgi:hypothetical protein
MESSIIMKGFANTWEKKFVSDHRHNFLIPNTSAHHGDELIVYLIELEMVRDLKFTLRGPVFYAYLNGPFCLISSCKPWQNQAQVVVILTIY